MTKRPIEKVRLITRIYKTIKIIDYLTVSAFILAVFFFGVRLWARETLANKGISPLDTQLMKWLAHNIVPNIISSLLMVTHLVTCFFRHLTNPLVNEGEDDALFSADERLNNALDVKADEYQEELRNLFEARSALVLREKTGLLLNIFLGISFLVYVFYDLILLL